MLLKCCNFIPNYVWIMENAAKSSRLIKELTSKCVRQ